MRLQGIPNLGNTCYINAVIQCLRRSLYAYPHSLKILDEYIYGNQSKGIPSIWDLREDNGMFDSHEFYMKFIDTLPLSVRNHFTIRYRDGTKSPFLLVNTELEKNEDEMIVYSPDVICVCKAPSPMRIKDLRILEVDEPRGEGIITKRYTLTSCICFEAMEKYELNHYYALVLNQNVWNICDDSHVSSIQDDNRRYPIYLLFYTS